MLTDPQVKERCGINVTPTHPGSVVESIEPATEVRRVGVGASRRPRGENSLVRMVQAEVELLYDDETARPETPGHVVYQTGIVFDLRGPQKVRTKYDIGLIEVKGHAHLKILSAHE